MLINISQIIIPDRARQVDIDSTEFAELKESIKEHGLLTPIAVKSFGSSYTLVCGARRLKACEQLNYIRIEANNLQINTDTEYLICELEENIRRKAFTWQEQVLATGKLYTAICETDKNMDLLKFSNILQQSHSKTSHDMDMFDNRFEHPTIYVCENWTRAKEELRRLKVAKLVEETVRRQRVEKIYTPEEIIPGSTILEYLEGKSVILPNVRTIPSALDIVYDSALHLLESLDDNSVDIICTDPPFGIDIQGSRHRRKQKKVYKEGYDDSTTSYFSVIDECIPHFSRVLKPGAHLYMFFGIELLTDVGMLLIKSGFKVHKVPLIWHRTHSGAAANQPYYLPASAYQAIMFAFAPGERRRLQKQGESNVITLPAIPPQKKVHPLEIPVHIYSDLIKRSACKGDLVVDPFCGTGNSLVAGLQCYCRVLGAEIREDYRNLAVLNVEERFRFEEDLRRGREKK